MVDCWLEGAFLLRPFKLNLLCGLILHGLLNLVHLLGMLKQFSELINWTVTLSVTLRRYESLIAREFATVVRDVGLESAFGQLLGFFGVEKILHDPCPSRVLHQMVWLKASLLPLGKLNGVLREHRLE